MLSLLLVAVGIGTSVGVLYAIWRFLMPQQIQLEPTSLKDKVVIVTGANSGIGFETALDFATRDARVILACRNPSKGEAAAAEIRDKTGNGNVVFRPLDLASLRSVRQFAASVLAEETRLDILVNNAGITETNGAKTDDGFEMIFGVNHLGHFHLTNLLLDRLKEAPSARIVTVSSMVHWFWIWGKFDFDMVNKYNRRHLGPLNVTYMQSKVANVLFTRELAKRLKGTNVTANALNPGIVNTQLFAVIKKNLYAGWSLVMQKAGNFMDPLISKSPQQGAQTSIYCAVSKELEGVSGKFFADCKEVDLTKLLLPAKGLTSEEDADRLWELSTSLVDSVKT